MSDDFDYDVGQKLGRLEAAVEALAQSLKEHMEREEKERVEFMARFKPIEEGMIVRRGVLNFIKMSAAVVGFLVAFKWQEAKALIQVVLNAVDKG